MAAAVPILFAFGVGGKILKSIWDDALEEELKREREYREALEQHMRDL